MKKLINKVKNYKPSKHVCFLYFFIPLFVCLAIKIDKGDVWFLLNHGKYVLEHGFPTIEPFSMHQGFSFVMQQWLSAVIFYLTYNFFGKYGLLLLIIIVNILILFCLYKLCMKLSDNRFRMSVIFSCIMDFLLISFFEARPYIFTFLFLIIVLYIMVSFEKDSNSKLIYFLPLISLLQINFHASMWFMIFLFILPFFVSFVYSFIKNRTDDRAKKLLLVLIIMFLVGFLNPYGIKNITYIFTSYGNYYINHSVTEMFPPSMLVDSEFVVFFYTSYLTLLIIFLVYILNKKGKLYLSHMLLLLGVSYLSITSIRNYPILVIGGIPFLTSYLKNLFPKEKEKKVNFTKEYKITYAFIVIFLVSFYFIDLFFIKDVTFTSPLEKGIDYLLSKNKVEDIVLYTHYNDGAYAEYRGLKPYIDARAEVFLKSNNKKEDIMKEYYLLSINLMDYNKFMNKYKFTHLIVEKNDSLYSHISKDRKYKVIYTGKKYKIFERKNI